MSPAPPLTIDAVNGQFFRLAMFIVVLRLGVYHASTRRQCRFLSFKERHTVIRSPHRIRSLPSGELFEELPEEYEGDEDRGCLEEEHCGVFLSGSRPERTSRSGQKIKRD